MPTETVGENTGDTYSGFEDVYMSDGSNHDGETILVVSQSAPWSILLRADGLSNITNTAVVSSAVMYLRVGDFGGGGSLTISVRRMLRAWVENEVTDTIYSTGNSWTALQGTSDGNDRTTERQSYSPTTTAGYQSFTSENFDSDIEDFINGTLTNDGHGLYGSAGSGERWFDSNDTSDGQRPYVSVTYTTDAITYNLKYTNGSTGVLANMIVTNGVSGAEIVLKRTNGSAGDIINTSGS